MHVQGTNSTSCASFYVFAGVRAAAGCIMCRERTLCDCETCGNRWRWTDPGFINKLFNEIYPSKKCSKVLLSYKWQFIAYARWMRGIEKRLYEYLKDALVNESSWAHGTEYLEERMFVE